MIRTSLESRLATLVPRAKRCRSRPTPQRTLDYWLSPPARIGIHRLAVAISEIDQEDYRSFFFVVLTSIIRQVSIADPAIPPLVRLREERAATAGPRYRQALRRSQSITASTVYADFSDSALKNIQRMSELYSFRHQLGSSYFPQSDADAARSGLPSDSIDAIVTSPPYCGSQKYVRSLKLELLINGCDHEELKQLDRQSLGTEAVSTRIANLSELLTGDSYTDQFVTRIYQANPVRARMASDYSKYLSTFASECMRVLRPGGQLLVTLGRSTLADIPFPADRVFRRAGQQVGFEFIATLVDRIRSRGLITHRHRTSRVIDSEYIVWMRRPHPTNLKMLEDSNDAKRN